MKKKKLRAEFLLRSFSETFFLCLVLDVILESFESNKKFRFVDFEFLLYG